MGQGEFRVGVRQREGNVLQGEETQGEFRVGVWQRERDALQGEG